MGDSVWTKSFVLVMFRSLVSLSRVRPKFHTKGFDTLCHPYLVSLHNPFSVKGGISYCSVFFVLQTGLCQKTISQQCTYLEWTFLIP